MRQLDPKRWVDQYADYLLRYAMFRLNDEALCEDLVQETFFSALKAKDSFRADSSEKTWLTSILRNKIIDEYRKKKQNFEAIEDEEFYSTFFEETDNVHTHWNKGQFPQSWEPGVIDNMVTKEYYQALHHCISKLSSTQAAILQQKYFEEVSSEKICKEFNISKSNYWTMMHRVNIQLRKCLELNWAMK